MPIDISKEQILSLTDAAKALPLVDRKRPHCSTLWRWARKGVRGVRLEYCRVGNRICTSTEALSRFVNALASADIPPAEVLPTVKSGERSATNRQRAIERANRSLSDMGL